MKKVLSCLGLCIVLAFLNISATAAAADLTVTVSKGGKKWLTFQGSNKGGSATSDRHKLAFTPDAKGFRFLLDRTELRLKVRESYKLYGPDGKLLFKVKRKEGKIKISRSEEDPEPWSIGKSEKGDAFKLKRGDADKGKSAWYADRREIKVKNGDGVVLCTAVTNAGGPVMGPAAALVEGLSDLDQLLLFALLSLMDTGI
jgi:hypothetical protein